MGDGDVGEEERGEREDEGGGDAGVERAVCAQDGHRLPVDADGAQELQLLGLALHGLLRRSCWRRRSELGGAGGEAGRVGNWGLRA